ncbi:guided entry of tail-anchored proteins factor CAMLG isoform X1 [Lithobates pipiens]
MRIGADSDVIRVSRYRVDRGTHCVEMITQGGEVVLGTSNGMEGPDGSGDSAPEKMSVSQRRAEIRRRKLMSNSEERMNRIMGIHKPVSSVANILCSQPGPGLFPLLHSHQTVYSFGGPCIAVSGNLNVVLSPSADTSSGPSSQNQQKSEKEPSSRSGYGRDGLKDELRLERLDKPNSLPLQSSMPKRGIAFSGDTGTSNEHSYGEGTAPFVEDLSKSSDFRKDSNGLRNRADVTSESTPRGLNQYLTRFDEAMKLRNHLNSEKPVPDSTNGVDEMDSFRVFRLVGSAILAVFVRMSVCKYLSIFAPFLTLQLAFMGLSKYFPKGEKKTKTTVLTAALLLSGIPSELISRSLDTYSKMADVFTDLCVYFFIFIFCHELLLFFGSEDP